MRPSDGTIHDALGIHNYLWMRLCCLSSVVLMLRAPVQWDHRETDECVKGQAHSQQRGSFGNSRGRRAHRTPRRASTRQWCPQRRGRRASGSTPNQAHMCWQSVPRFSNHEYWHTYPDESECNPDAGVTLKRHLSIPVIVNGGITSLQDGYNKCGPCDGFYIGQASFGNPWVFTEAGSPSSFKEKVPLILKHTQWLTEDKGEFIGTREIRKHLLQYVKGFPGAKHYRTQLVHVKTYNDVERALELIVSECNVVPV